jgi:two-component system LytT family sensor kinase
MKEIKLKTYQLHLLSWAIFILYELLVNYSYRNTLLGFADYAGYYALNIGLFYFHSHITFEKIYKENNNRYLLGVIIVLELSAYTGIKYILYLLFLHYEVKSYAQIPPFNLFVSQSLWRAIYFIGLSTGYTLFISTLRDRQHIAKLEQERLLGVLEKEALENKLLETENTYLKVQINPHFLFNTLGFMHNSILKYSPAAAEAVVVLSEMMRYALDKSQKDAKVFLEDEIEQINNYILISQRGFSNKLNISFTCEGDVTAIRIPPLLLITIVENIFKYGDLSKQNSPAKIMLTVNRDELTFQVYNKKLNSARVHGFGIGMSNVVKRLDLYYTDRYEISIDNSEREYYLTLIIKT